MPKVLIGMSGGVDSSVAAYLLQKEGYEVEGVTFIFVDNYDVKDAEEVARKLGIKHHVVDYRIEFQEKIINKFIKDYQNNLTPNPCVICNRDIKEKLLFDLMKEYNCDYIATGHYSKIKDNSLYKSEDKNKDQSYFLSLIRKEVLNKLLLPLEGIDKQKVREIAQEINLVNATKKDSTDVCFINSKFNEYISKYIKNEEGNIVDIKTNKVMGKHNGLSRYTIGQRRGLDIGGTTSRAFVVGKDIEKGILYIGIGEDNEFLESDSCVVEEFNYLKEEKITSCKAKFRYRQVEVDVNIEWIDDNKIIVKYPQKEKRVTRGQACVLYLGEECLGGGIITEVRKNNKKLDYI